MKKFERLLLDAARAAPTDLAPSFVIFGSAPLASVGIRPDVDDLDLFVSDETFDELVRRGYESRVKRLDPSTGESVHHVVLVPGPAPGSEPDVEVFRTFQGVDYASVARRATAHESGMRMASLPDVRAWKVASARPKDLADVASIDRYLAELGRRG